MPEFKLDYGTQDAARIFAQLDDFTQGYVEAMFFTDIGSDHELAGADFSQLAPATLDRIKQDCRNFRDSLPEDTNGDSALERAYDHPTANYNAKRAGNDFWYTRNGHGTGFWDRDLGPIGNELSDAAHTYREVDLYRGDDDLIYIS